MEKIKFRKVLLFVPIFFLSLLILPLFSSQARNLHEIDSNENGFALYRSGNPWPFLGVKKWCKLGIQEVMVLNGSAKNFELSKRAPCKIKVIFNKSQDSKKPLDKEFLEKFDKWVAGAKMQGKKILFRCTCGCHRTGRLAAYYQMKYRGLSTREAIWDMKRRGYIMEFYQHLNRQVAALHDFIKGKPCSTEKKHCVDQ